MTVGPDGVITPQEARRRAALIIARIKAGEEAVPEPLSAKFAKGPTVADLARRYLEDHVAVGDVKREPPDLPSIRARRWAFRHLRVCLWATVSLKASDRMFEARSGVPVGRAGWDGTLEQEIQEWASLYPGESIDLERVLAYSHRKHYLRLLGSDEYFEQRSVVVSRESGNIIAEPACSKRF